MNVQIHTDNFDNSLLDREYPDNFYDFNENINEIVTHFDYPFGKAYNKEIYFEGVHINYGNSTFHRDFSLNFESNFETVEMLFVLKGKNKILYHDFDKKEFHNPNEFNIMYGNSVSGEILCKNGSLEIFEVNFSPIFFQKFLPDNSNLFEDFRNAMEKGNSKILDIQNKLITNQMYQIIEDIIECNRKGIYKRMFLEAKIIELLLLQFEQIDKNKVSLNKQDIDKIYAVREFIINNLNNNYSLIDLAHNVGTNEFKLKKGFKEIFGTTVFGFWNDIKMKQAKKLLREQEMNINEISDLIGYKNSRYFSMAFKRKFGISPSKFKENTSIR